MAINKSKGNMYRDYDTWNGMYGICPYNCIYCYNRIHWNKWGKMRLNERTLKDNLGSGNFYFVGSSCDMFAENIPTHWIKQVLKYCLLFDNTYLFQTKNPQRFKEFLMFIPEKSYLGTTIETNRLVNSKAPTTYARAYEMSKLPNDKMVSIEPIMDFDLDDFVNMIKDINPKYVSIGANTNRKVKLPEPTEEKIKSLIKELSKFTEVRIKDNLKRLTGGVFTQALNVQTDTQLPNNKIERVVE